MLNLPSELRNRTEPIRVGVIGTGVFGTKLVDQIERAPGMRTTAIADIDEATALAAYEEANVPSDDVQVVEDAVAADAVCDDGNRAILLDGTTIAETAVDVVVEATGDPNAAARHAYRAIMEEKHVVMATVETDTVVGPLLAELAKSVGVSYSMAYGDQPALIVELCDWAETIGLDIVAAGKGNPYREEYRHGTPDDVFERFGYDRSFVEEHNLNARMYNSFLDGTKVAVEMCAVANATGFQPDVPGMHLPTAEIPEIPETFRLEADGGILNETGVVDTVSTLRPDGSSVDRDIGFGVFVVTTTPNERVREYLVQNAGTGLYVAGDGEYQVFHRPYHLPGVETPVSVANAAIRGEATGVPSRHVGEVVGAAKRDLEPGDVLDGGGGYTVYGRLETADRARAHDHVPFELLDRAKVRNPIAADEILTYADIELEETFLRQLRRVQESR